ncbi:hypothetical protein PHYSODRAFT_529400 [Phytophthora sojae]|uniref:Jacalin-type lectin domain-containing protein n=1 Tax=Phytophthora sojae (strain P6497) TaxID=1094619 RepID=G5AAC1_PHYSP|nr:hypothetical protein PHYSODRAFT_529400 [Phytophthora sojae]EGZ07550.1 hypothetical protein PHYSODRAFT_529400 [Phytophthora sojae]|eukprot:XP_009537116.1 hypothetical protein PHYSODRAFT_529400 [Phytophthora sojae]
MKFFSQILATVALLATGTIEGGTAADDHFSGNFGTLYGEPHGKPFDDSSFARAGEIVQSVSIRTGERVNGVGIAVEVPGGKRASQFRGGEGRETQTLIMRPGERVKCIEAHTGKHHGRTRVRYIKITSTTGKEIKCGTMASDKAGAIDGFQLGGFHGSSDVELDQMGAIWVVN